MKGDQKRRLYNSNCLAVFEKKNFRDDFFLRLKKVTQVINQNFSNIMKILL